MLRKLPFSFKSLRNRRILDFLEPVKLSYRTSFAKSRAQICSMQSKNSNKSFILSNGVFNFINKQDRIIFLFARNIYTNDMKRRSYETCL